MWFAFYLSGMMVCLIGSVYYSVEARRRGIHPLKSRMTLGKMNMMMGCLLLLLGINQLTFEDLGSVRIVVALIFLIVGAINLFLGTRNYLRYRREWLAAEK